MDWIDPAQVQAEIEEVIRTFPAEFITVKRPESRWVEGNKVPIYKEVYRGEALVRPANGTVDRYGMGQTENFDLSLLIAGAADIRQGDEVVLNDPGLVPNARYRLYRVVFPPFWMNAFLVVNLKQAQQ